MQSGHVELPSSSEISPSKSSWYNEVIRTPLAPHFATGWRVASKETESVKPRKPFAWAGGA